MRQGQSTYWRVPFNGGTPAQLSDKSASWAAVSPDGKLVALRYFDEQAKTNKLAVLPFAGGDFIKTIDVSVSFRDVGLGWSADSKSIIYAEGRGEGSADNIWSVSIEGGSPKQLTTFTSGLIFAFQVSRDNRQIALSRGTQTDDVILLRETE